MNRKEIVAVLKKEMKLAEKRADKAHKAEKDWDYSDAMLSVERAFADGYLEALCFLSNRIDDEKSKKKPKKKGKAKK